MLTTTTRTVYLVKFDKGYYAKKQPDYNWSFTNDPMLAYMYLTQKSATERASWGLNLITDRCLDALVEGYELTTTTSLIKI